MQFIEVDKSDLKDKILSKVLILMILQENLQKMSDSEEIEKDQER